MDFEDELIDELRQIKYYLKAVALTRIEELWGPYEHDANWNKEMSNFAINAALDIENPEVSLQIEADKIEADKIEADKIEAERLEAERIKEEERRKREDS